MSSSIVLVILFAALLIAAMVVLLAATRWSLSGPIPGGHPEADGKYPSGYWMSIGLTVGVALGLLLGLVLQSLAGGISIGIGLGLIVGKWLDRRYDTDITQYTEQQKQERLRRATWGLVVMILFVLATLAAAILPLLD